MLLILAPFIGWSAVIGAFGFAVNEAGDAAEKTSNAFVKSAIVGAGLYIVLKQTKVI
jgi:hypothetical protein